MRIGQKNSLLVVGMMLLVLVGVTGAGYLLVTGHVNRQISSDIQHAHEVYVQAQREAFAQLVSTARTIGQEPGLLAALLTAHPPTVRSTLEESFPRPGLDLLALSLENDPGRTLAEASKPHLVSPRVLASDAIQTLVRQVSQGARVAYGNAMIFETFLRLVAIPVVNPGGGVIGVMVLGQEIDQAALERHQPLLRTQVALYDDQALVGATLPARLAQLQGLEPGRVEFSLDGAGYLGRVYPVLAGDGRTPVARLLLAHASDSYWVPYRSFALQGLLVSGAVLVVAAVLGMVISRRTLTRPLSLLAAATRKIAAGDLSWKVELVRDDELGELAESFNRMLDDLRRSNEALEHNRRRFHDFAESSSDWLWETDAEGRFSYLSPGFKTSLGMDGQQCLGRTWQEVFPEDDLEALTARLRPQRDRGFPFKDLTLRVCLHDATSRDLRISGIPVREQDRFAGFRGTASDISKQRINEERVALLSNQDQLTGLANRRRFLVDLAHEIRRAQAHTRQGVLMLVDLDHLKLLNDAAGYAVGDEMIVQVAGVLERLARAEDIIGRISGDEFALTLPDLSLEEARTQAQRILDAIAECRPVRTKAGVPINVSASIGLVGFPDQGTDPVELIAKADSAMYAAKDAGRNRFEIFDATSMSREHIGGLLASRNRVLRGLEEDRFELHFQPIASVLNGEVHHFETLVRMRDDGGQLHPPSAFIPAAEQFGLIGRVDREIVRKAIYHIATLPDALGQVGFSINLSGLSVGEAEMLSLIEGCLDETGLDPARITFELTETAACENMALAAEFLSRIRQLGCRIALDDFGVGFSSFSYLKHLHVDMLKIDGSFIRDIASNREDQLFVKALVDVARGMGIRTIAEFVESEAAFRLLQRLGVDYVQGYHIGRPEAAITEAGLHGFARRLNPGGGQVVNG
ncbi:putative bifunctional diguanylate cyclase/phosphodiesterase [Thiohalobacter thiocyanaticus]|uniref:EAL domain-containing protein n=1 Tax=Thiohalobacter thiocyanaticus TaxID=585455 RepID=A0A426QJC2_9GAMM|nr:EAL domain-containing protein [Thiohalobacter thiocyanaticus]RRQ21872.1 EAL domain-containing protein [Thiohalobacter thiocyanaticus]